MKKKFKEKHIKVCPECNSHTFYKDTKHHETSCKVCGLVLIAPYSADFITPDFKIITITVTVSENCIK